MKMPQNEDAKRRMINACRFYYRDNQRQLLLIDEFDQSYRADEAIQWYTRPSFVYKLVNKALRTEDVEQLDIFRFFIHDLRVCLAREHKLIREFESKLTLYRGATLSLSDLEAFTQNPKTLISTNGFLSTSRSRQVAEIFVDKSKIRNDAVPVLFEIECDVDSLGNAVVLADISYLSRVRDEDEVIFDLGATFCIDNITRPKENTPLGTVLIQMHATTEGYEIAREYINENRLNMTNTNVRVIFGKLLMDMGQHDKALLYFQELIKESDLDDLAWAHVNLGSVYRGLGQYIEAKTQYAIAYDLCAETEPPRYHDAASIIDNLGVIWDDMGRIEEAFDFHKFAYKIRKEFLGPDHIETGTSLMNIGSVYYSKCYYEQALNCFLRALEINQDCLPSNHPDTAELMANIGIVYMRICDYEGALEYLQQALEMQQKCLPAMHISTANTLNNLGNVYYKLGDDNNALYYYSKSLKTYEACLSAYNTSFTAILDNIGNIYCNRHEYDQALELKLKALHIRQRILPDNHPDTATSLFNISTVYIGMQEYDKALEYAKQALSIRTHSEIVELLSIGSSLTLLGDIYLAQGEYTQSLECHLKALENRKKMLPIEDRSIGNSLYSVGLLYERLGNASQALDYYTNALITYNECLPDEHPRRKMTKLSIIRTKLLSKATEHEKISRSASDAPKPSERCNSSNSNRRQSFG